MTLFNRWRRDRQPDRTQRRVFRRDRPVVGRGYLRGSSILISGSPGTSKTSLTADFMRVASQAGRCGAPTTTWERVVLPQ